MDEHVDVRQAAKPGKVSHTSGIGKSVSAFYLGLAQLVSLGASPPLPSFHRRSDAEALKGDWIKVGGDMYAAIKHERERAGQ